MIEARTTYAQFTSLKNLFGAKFSVLYMDNVAEGGAFTAVATDGGSLAMCYTGAVGVPRPVSFALDFPTAVQVDSLSIA